MKNNILFGSALTVLCGLALPALSTTTLAAEASAQIEGGRPAADLARADRGVRLEVQGANAEAAQVLIGKDSTATFALPVGTTSMIMALPKAAVVNHFDFVTGGAEGKVTVSVADTKLSFDSADWREVAGGQAFSGNQLIPCDLGSVDARYVKLDFAASTAGKLSGFNLFGQSAAPMARAKGEFHVSVATPANANAEYNVTFDDASAAPKVVADLGENGALNRITCAYQAPAGTLDFYLVGTPDSQTRVDLNYVGEPSLQPVSNPGTAPENGNVLAGKQPIYSIDTNAQSGSGKVTADLGKLQGRYLVAAFRPARRHHAVDGKDVEAKDVSKGKDAKEAPVFPFFSSNPAFGTPGTASGTPLLPPPLGDNSP